MLVFSWSAIVLNRVGESKWLFARIKENCPLRYTVVCWKLNQKSNMREKFLWCDENFCLIINFCIQHTSYYLWRKLPTKNFEKLFTFCKNFTKFFIFVRIYILETELRGFSRKWPASVTTHCLKSLSATRLAGARKLSRRNRSSFFSSRFISNSGLRTRSQIWGEERGSNQSMIGETGRHSLAASSSQTPGSAPGPKTGGRRGG